MLFQRAEQFHAFPAEQKRAARFAHANVFDVLAGNLRKRQQHRERAGELLPVKHRHVQRHATKSLHGIEDFADHRLVRGQEGPDVRLIRDVPPRGLLVGIRVENPARGIHAGHGVELVGLGGEPLPKQPPTRFRDPNHLGIAAEETDRLLVVGEVLRNSLGGLAGENFFLRVKLINRILTGTPVCARHEITAEQCHPKQHRHISSVSHARHFL